MNRFLRTGWIGFFLLAWTPIAGCARKPPQLIPTKPPQVLVSLPVVKEITDYEDFTGRTDAVKTVEVRARVDGYLEKVYFKEGTEVNEGDLLFEIDPRPYQADLAKAEANVLQSEAHFRRLDADYRRAVSLFARKVISQEEFDKDVGDRAEAEAAVDVAKASRDLAQLNLKFTKVRAPISGRISRQLIDPGNLVKADVTPLTTIVALNPMYVYFDVDERTMLRVRRLIREGKVKSAREAVVPIMIGLSDEEGFPHQGTINFIDNRVDPSTGTLRVRAIFQNPRDPRNPTNNTRIFSPGMFVRIRLPIGTPHPALLISERAMGTDQGQKFLYVVNKRNEVVYRRVTTGLLNNGLRVIEQGLAPGERVIVSGLQRVRPGIQVDPKLEDMPAEVATAPPALVTNRETSLSHRSSR